MGIISLPDKTTRDFFRVLPLHIKKQLSILVTTFSGFSFPSFKCCPRYRQVENYLFPLSRILRSLSQSIRTIFHSTRQTLESISYCFGTCGIYSTFYISIDFFLSLFLFYFFLFSWGC